MILLLLAVTVSCAQAPEVKRSLLPEFVIGTFADDYEIQYTITQALWLQLPESGYRVTYVNLDGQYLIAQNSSDHPTEPELWSRIDWMELESMEPFGWAFCLSAYDAVDASSAEKVTLADRTQPRSGCNGFPFSRMKRLDAS